MHTKAVKYFSAISLNENIKFLRLLIRWQGSVWKLLWIDFVCFSICYIAIAILYRVYLINDPIQKTMFDSVVVYFNRVGSIVPLSFLLGFFVSTVLGRWWKIISSIPWMNKPAFTCQALITGDDRITSKCIRHTIVRYMNLAWILSIMFISNKVKKRFRVNIIHKISNENYRNDDKPKLITIRDKMNQINSDEVVKEYFGELIMEEEIEVFENFEKINSKPTFVTPLMWATRLIEKCRDAEYIKSDSICMNLFTMIDEFKTTLENLEVYNEFNVPLVYTQVIVIVVYTFLISELLSEQIISKNISIYESYFPIFGIFKFIIYMGWFKMGLSFINPFGSDPSDLPLDEILNYNLEISSIIAAAEDCFYPDYLLNSNSFENNFENLSNFRLIPKSVELSEKSNYTRKRCIDGHVFATHDEQED